jgi:hypothetical protein
MSNNNQNINTNNEYNTEAMPMDCVDDGASLYLSSEELSSADKGQGSASPKRIFEDSNLQNIENAVGELGTFSQFQLPRSLKTVCWAANCNSADMLAAKGIFIPMKPGTTRMLHACRNFVPINGCVHRLNVVDPRKNLGSAIDFVHSCNLSIITCCPKRGKGRTELAGGRIGSCHHQLVRQVGGRKWSRRA